MRKLGLVLTVAMACRPLFGAEGLSARVITANGAYKGSVVGQSAEGLDVKTETETKTVAADQVKSIKFNIKKWDYAKSSAEFMRQEFGTIYQDLNGYIRPYVEYGRYKSNLSPAFYYMMVSSFWERDYELTLLLADGITQSGPAKMTRNGQFYGALAKLEQGDIEPIKKLMASPDFEEVCPSNSPGRFYLNAKVAQKNGDYMKAIGLASSLINQYAQFSNWVTLGELTIAELYFQMEMPESAESVLADIRQYNSNPKILEKAAAIAATMNKNGEDL